MADVLTIDKLSAGYGEAVALSGISLALRQGEALALLGRNGVGKTTLLNSIIGVTRRFAGTIMLSGHDVTRYRPEQRAVAGVGWVLQERNIFKSLTVEENLTAVALPGVWDVARVYEMFPRLRERRPILVNSLHEASNKCWRLGAHSSSTRRFCCWRANRRARPNYCRGTSPRIAPTLSRRTSRGGRRGTACS